MKMLLMATVLMVSACALNPAEEARINDVAWLNACVATTLDEPVRPVPPVTYVNDHFQMTSGVGFAGGSYSEKYGVITVVEGFNAPYYLVEELLHYYGVSHGEMFAVSSPIGGVDTRSPVERGRDIIRRCMIREQGI